MFTQYIFVRPVMVNTEFLTAIYRETNNKEKTNYDILFSQQDGELGLPRFTNGK